MDHTSGFNTARRLLLAVLLSAATLLLHAAPSGAIELALGEDSFRATWEQMELATDFASVRCDLTLDGSFHSRVVSKVERSLIGSITEATFASCTGGDVTALAETLPWHIQYESFSGTLPDIASLDLRLVGVGVRMQFQEFDEITCLARTEESTPLGVAATRDETGDLVSLVWDESSLIPITGGFICSLAGDGSVIGASESLTGPGGTEAVSLALIGEAPFVTPSPIDFGRVEAEAVVSRALTIRAGTNPIEVRSVALTGGASFALLDPNRCAGRRLAEREACVVQTIFAAPRETGRAFEDAIVVETSGGRLEAALRAST